jgi:inositol transport system substrate-binding protein
MKKFLALCLLLCVVAGAWASGSSEAGKKTVIGCAIREFSDKWVSYCVEGMKRFEKEHPDVQLVFTDAKSDAALQVSQIETIISNGAKGILVSAVDPSTFKAMIPITKKAGVFLTSSNGLPEQAIMDQLDGFVGTKSIEAGQFQADWIKKNVPQGGKVGIMMGMLVHEAAQMRTKGVKEGLAGNAKYPIVVEAEGSWDRNKGLQIAENWLQGGTGVTIFACNNDEMAIGAVLAARSMGLKDKDLYILGVDGTSDALEFVGEGLDMTLLQDPDVIGYEGVNQIYKMIKKQPFEKMQWISHTLITAENKAKFIKK